MVVSTDFMALHAEIWFDGASEPTNPGPSVAGAYVIIDGTKPVHLYRDLGWNTNNVAEWEGLVLGLEYALSKGVSEVSIFGDSKLVIEQARGAWRVKKNHLKPFKEKADALLKKLGSRPMLTWIPREMNRQADLASRKYGVAYPRSS